MEGMSCFFEHVPGVVEFLFHLLLWSSHISNVLGNLHQQPFTLPRCCLNESGFYLWVTKSSFSCAANTALIRLNFPVTLLQS